MPARTYSPLPALLAGLITLLTGCGNDLPPVSASTTDRTEVNAGGADATVNEQGANSFGRPAPGLGLTDKGLFENGNHLFRTPRGRERGTGPILNAQTCQGCHVLDGKGNPPRSVDNPLKPEGHLVSMLLKLGSAQNGTPDPIYGNQLQVRSLYGGADNPNGLAWHNGSLNNGPALGEARVRIEYETIQGAYPDGSVYELLNPVYRLSAFSYGPMAQDTRFSPRVAPGVYGNGLLGAIPAASIIAGTDPDDRNQDGISGRANRVEDPVTGQAQLGRFGLKAGSASVLSQTVAAYRNDMGLTSRFANQEACTDLQTACLEAANQEQDAHREPGGIDVLDIDVAQVEFYVRTLAVPRRRGWDAARQRWSTAIQKGRELFFETGCISCHTPRWRTGTAQGSVLGDASLLTSLTQPAPPLPVLSDKIIWPYTDLLLHDMGGSCTTAWEDAAGSACAAGGSACSLVQRCNGLADGMPEQAASGSEWRTPPLWGVGLVQSVNPAAGFLHDGRARTLEEAILWHGQATNSEAAETTRRFKSLSEPDRTAVISFLESL